MKPGLYFSLEDGVVYARVKINGTTKKFSTRIKIDDKRNFKHGGVMPRDMYTRSADQNLRDLRDKFDRIKIEPYHTAVMIRDMLRDEYIEGQNEFTLMNAMEHGLSLSKLTVVENTYNQYVVEVESFRKWFKYHTGYEDVALSGITNKIGVSFVESCIQDNQKTGTIKRKLSILGKFYDDYVLDYQDEVAAPQNPFSTATRLVSRMKSKVKKESSKEFIMKYWHQEEEVKQIREFKFMGSKKHKYERYRWAAMWQIVTGWSFDDMGSDDWEIKELDGKRYIKIIRGKTLNPCYIPFSEEIEFVRKKLKENCLGGRLFPFKRFIKNGKTNLKLKDSEYGKYTRFLAKFTRMLGFDEMRTHKFRHTFGMTMSKRGYTTNQIAKMMGHANPATTEGFYVTETEEQIVSEMLAIKPNSK